MTKTKKPITAFVITSLIVFVLFITYFCVSLSKKEVKELPLLGSVPQFSLVDSTSSSFTNKHLEGKVWVANFMFTTCPGPCPIMNAEMAKLYRSYILEKNVDFVSISVNPGHDSPQKLTEYAKKYQANTNRWHFLTGDLESIHKIAHDGFKLGSKENPIVHSTYFVLVDQKNQIRGYYQSTEKSAIKQLFIDISTLVRQ